MTGERPESAGALPGLDPDSMPFWTALADGRLLLPHCERCQRSFFPPMPSCPRCGSIAIELRVSMGEGQIYSWVTVHMALDPQFADEVPYSVVAVDLADGGRMLGRFLGDRSELIARQHVRLTTYTARNLSLPGFVPVR
jgi:uncharacterized protein